MRVPSPRHRPPPRSPYRRYRYRNSHTVSGTTHLRVAACRSGSCRRSTDCHARDLPLGSLASGSAVRTLYSLVAQYCPLIRRLVPSGVASPTNTRSNASLTPRMEWWASALGAVAAAAEARWQKLLLVPSSSLSWCLIPLWSWLFRRMTRILDLEAAGQAGRYRTTHWYKQHKANRTHMEQAALGSKWVDRTIRWGTQGKDSQSLGKGPGHRHHGLAGEQKQL